jgi:hypothetical protein
VAIVSAIEVPYHVLNRESREPHHILMRLAEPSSEVIVLEPAVRCDSRRDATLDLIVGDLLASHRQTKPFCIRPHISL